MNPKVTQRDPKRGQGRPKASQKGVQWRPRGTQKYLLAPKREFKGGLYTQKLPINRTSGHYVIITKMSPQLAHKNSTLNLTCVTHNKT